MYKRNTAELLRWFMAVGETWVHHCASVTKKQSKQLTQSSEPALKNAEAVSSDMKVEATVFWGTHGIIFIKYNAILSQRLNNEIKSKRSHLA